MYSMLPNELLEDKTIKLCNYLVLIEKLGCLDEVIPCTNFQQVLNICKNEKKLCRVFERAGSMGKHWNYVCEMSRGVV